MTQGDKKNSVDGWKVVGIDSLGRPVFKKDNPIREGNRKYKDMAKRALDPMSDIRTKADNDRINSLPPQFLSVFFEEGGKWKDSSHDGNALYGATDSGSEVVMSRQYNDIVIAVDGEVSSIIGPAEERELRFQYIENELGGQEQIDRKGISSANVSIDENTGKKKVAIITSENTTLSYDISDDGKTATGYITTIGEDGKTDIREIAQDIPTEDIVEVSNEIAEQEDPKKTNIFTIGRALMLAKHLGKEWDRYREKNRKDPPRFLFEGHLARFFDKALVPFGRF